MSAGRRLTHKAVTHVLKFGGSSVGNAQAFQNVGSVLLANRDAGYRTVGVLSAMFGVTNKLLEAAKASVAGRDKEVRDIRSRLVDLHWKVSKELLKSGANQDDTLQYIEATFKRYFDDVCHRISLQHGCAEYDLDCISSVGERWSTRIMSAHLGERRPGLEAPFLESDGLIVTDGVSGNAKPILDVTRRRIDSVLRPLIERNALPLVTGYFGASSDGKLTTLGRGGSDLSAAVLGYCLDAAEVSIWKVEYTTDADGWMREWTTGWEGVVHDAEPDLTIPSLAYEEAAELAHFGKKVLHPETVMPAVEKNIPISVRNTYNPSHPGTRIIKYPVTGSSSRIQAVTKVPLKAYEDKNSPLSDLDLSHLKICREESVLIVLVGFNIMAVHNLSAQVTNVLKAAGIPAYIPKKVNGSANNFSIIVPESKRNETVELLHKRFVKNEPPTTQLPVPQQAGQSESEPYELPDAKREIYARLS